MTADSEREARFAGWLEEHGGILHKIVRAYAKDAADQADLHQEILLQLWRSLPAFREQAKPSTWIYRVCLNTALTWSRGTAQRARRIASGMDFAHIASEAASPADRTADRELLGQLYVAIRTLSDFDRALVLLLLDELPYREIAEVTGLTENHVGVALTRARKRLAALMKGVIDELE